MKTNFRLCAALALFSTAFHAQTIKATVSGPVGSDATAGNSSTFVGTTAGNVATGAANTFVGFQSGKLNTSGTQNTFLGNLSGPNVTTGSFNTMIGRNTGTGITTGEENTYLGSGAGIAGSVSSSLNTFLGASAGAQSTSNMHNLYVGGYSGSNATGNFNTFLGTGAGSDNIGSQNIFIGYLAGSQSTSADNNLIIENSAATATAPLIWGDFIATRRQLKFSAKVGIGLESGFGTFPSNAAGINVGNYRLFVKGGILTEEVRVTTVSNWADYVFEKNYALKSLHEVEKFIAENGHLPNVPSAKQIKEEGFELSRMATIQQEKIEELTLYLIQQQKEIEELKVLVKTLTNNK